MTKFLQPTRERFLLAIAAELPAERFIELHFFQPIRQGGVESGVAVIAAYPESQPQIILADAPPPPDAVPSEAEAVIASEASGHPSQRVPLLAEQDENQLLRPVAPQDDTKRYTVYSARYKLVLKGPDRGKWECSVVAEADAPLVTVESVVRGVMRRSGDAEEPERMTGDEARDYVLAATR